jgi:hypothetical protein
MPKLCFRRSRPSVHRNGHASTATKRDGRGAAAYGADAATELRRSGGAAVPRLLLFPLQRELWWCEREAPRGCYCSMSAAVRSGPDAANRYQGARSVSGFLRRATEPAEAVGTDFGVSRRSICPSSVPTVPTCLESVPTKNLNYINAVPTVPTVPTILEERVRSAGKAWRQTTAALTQPLSQNWSEQSEHHMYTTKKGQVSASFSGSLRSDHALGTGRNGRNK